MYKLKCFPAHRHVANHSCVEGEPTVRNRHRAATARRTAQNNRSGGKFQEGGREESGRSSGSTPGGSASGRAEHHTGR